MCVRACGVCEGVCEGVRVYESLPPSCALLYLYPFLLPYLHLPPQCQVVEAEQLNGLISDAHLMAELTRLAQKPTGRDKKWLLPHLEVGAPAGGIRLSEQHIFVCG